MKVAKPPVRWISGLRSRPAFLSLVVSSSAPPRRSSDADLPARSKAALSVPLSRWLQPQHETFTGWVCSRTTQTQTQKLFGWWWTNAWEVNEKGAFGVLRETARLLNFAKIPDAQSGRAHLSLVSLILYAFSWLYQRDPFRRLVAGSRDALLKSLVHRWIYARYITYARMMLWVRCEKILPFPWKRAQMSNEVNEFRQSWTPSINSVITSVE